MTILSEAHAATAAASIQEDARFIVRVARAMKKLDAEQIYVIAMALLPSFALISYESRRWLEQHLSTVADVLPSKEMELVAAIRHAGKWLGADKGSVDARLESYRRVRAAHIDRFMGNTPYRWARKWETDLGLYRLHGVDVLNTHLLGVVLGDKPPEQLGPLLRHASETMSRQANILSQEQGAGPSFLDKVGPVSLRDVRSDRYFRDSGRTDLDVAGYLHILWCSLAFLRVLNVADPDDEGTVFKLQFVGLFHVTQSLKMLDPELAAGVGELAEGDIARRLRNDLVHYTPHDKTPASALDPSCPRRALIEHAYRRDALQVAEQLRTTIEGLHARMGKALGRAAHRGRLRK